MSGLSTTSDIEDGRPLSLYENENSDKIICSKTKKFNFTKNQTILFEEP